MYFLKRSDNWRNMYDSSVGFIRPKNKDGTWLEDFDPLKNANHGGFIEANSWQTTWMATHDVKGLAELMGGFDNYTDKLNEAFEKSEKSDFIGGHGNTIINYANEPGIYMAHLFVYAGKPWLAQYWARQVYNRVYSEATPDKGYGGHDEDQGKSGSVSALLSMGLYQLMGGVDKDAIYEITAPIFESVTIHLDPRYYRGKTFKIIAKNQAPENFYIQSAKLNGKKLDRAWISHAEFANGGVLELELGDKPNKSWGVKDIPNPETYADTLKKN